MILLIFMTMIYCDGPTNTDDPGKLFVANVGSNIKIPAGSYAIIDASKSIINGVKCDSIVKFMQNYNSDSTYNSQTNDFLLAHFSEAKIQEYWINWEQDINNPEEVALNSTDGIGGLYQAVSFEQPGKYIFYLTIQSNYEGEILSNKNKLTIEVATRQNSVIKDPNLESLIRYILRKPTEEICDEDFRSITNIEYDIVTNKIKSLDGLEKFTNLLKLHLNLNSINDLEPISLLSKLEFLEINQNQITNLNPLSNLTNLVYLDLSYNNIENVTSLDNMNELKTLKLLENNICDISPLKNLYGLDTLWISYSDINDISALSDLVNLKSLWLSDTNIENISPLSQLSNLNYLYLKRNKIEDISSLNNLNNLERLFLDGNSIDDISVLKNLDRLLIFNLCRNNIKNIKSIYENTGIGKNRFSFIELNGNPLDSISINYYIPEIEKKGDNIKVFY